MSKKQVPNSNVSPIVKKEVRASAPVGSYKQRSPSWRVSCIDWDCKWCLANLLDPFCFHYTDDILGYVYEENNDELDAVFNNIDGKWFDSLPEFWKTIHAQGINYISMNILKSIEHSAKKTIFQQNIFPKLKNFETLTWDEIDKQAGGPKNHSRNHYIELEDLDADAQKRLSILKYDDVERLYSLRFDATTRMFGIIRDGCFDILWLTLNHDICKSEKKHT